MNKFLLAFFTICLFTFQFLEAQVVSFTDEIQLRTEVGYEIIGELMGNTLLFKDRSNEYEIQAFNEKMEEAWVKKIKLDRRNARILGMVSRNDYFILLYQYKLRGDVILKAHKYDPGANLMDSTVVKNYGRQFITPDFNFTVSEDENKMLIYYLDNQKVINSLVFDIGLFKTSWEKVFELDAYSYARDDLYFLTNNTGDLILIIEKDNSASRREKHQFVVFHYDNQGAEYRRYIIPMNKMLNYDVYFKYDNLNDNIAAVGFYSEKNLLRTTGYFTLFIPRDVNKNYSLIFRKFDDDLVSALTGKNNQDNKGLLECSIEDMILRSDGGILLIGEMNRQYERRLAGSGRVVMDSYNRFIVDYYFDDIFILSINPDGKIHWEEILYKKQYSQDDNAVFSSFFLFRNPTTLRFLFNDEIKVENTVSEYILNSNGRVERKSILNTQNLKLRLRFRDAVQVDFNEVIIPSERRNRLRLVKIEY